MNNFTTSEYIAKHNLGVDPHDPRATKIIAKHLLAKGFKKKRVIRDGKHQLIWTTDPIPDYHGLVEKLEKLP